MELSKEFEMYRKIEVVLFRYFKIAEFLENSLRMKIKTKDDIKTILSPKGYVKGSINIPYNPFYTNEDEKQVFLKMFPDEFWNIEDNEKERRQALGIIWERIHEIKWWIGVTEGTRYCGIKKESRLVYILETYLRTGIKQFRYDFEFSIFKDVNEDTIRKFLSVAKNRKQKNGIKWLAM